MLWMLVFKVIPCRLAKLTYCDFAVGSGTFIFALELEFALSNPLILPVDSAARHA